MPVKNSVEETLAKAVAAENRVRAAQERLDSEAANFAKIIEAHREERDTFISKAGAFNSVIKVAYENL